jgi:hypothetical protein
MPKYHFIRYSIAFFIVAIGISTASISCSQEKTYWVANTFNKVNGKPMHGATPDFIGDMLTDFKYLVKDGQTFHFDFPKKKDIKLDTLKSFTYKRFQKGELNGGAAAGSLIDSIYKVGLVEGLLQIEFNFAGTGDDDKRFVVKFEKVTAAAYNKEIAEELAYIAEKQQAFDGFMKDYKLPATWNKSVKGKLASQQMPALPNSVKLSYPAAFRIVEDGNFYKNTFDQVKAGTLASESDNYVIKWNGGDKEIEDAHLMLVKAPASAFNLARYLTSKPNSFKVLSQDQDGFHALDLSYSDKSKKVTIKDYISFKHFFKDGVHLFYIATDAQEDGQEAALQHYLLMQQLQLSQ